MNRKLTGARPLLRYFPLDKSVDEIASNKKKGRGGERGIMYPVTSIFDGSFKVVDKGMNFQVAEGFIFFGV